ncbi:MAG: ABC transporter ATP-binding protein [Promethearchaeota archaeon]
MSKIETKQHVIPNHDEVIIKLENVGKNYGSFQAVKNINLEVNKGETVGLVGPNGAGKTTIIKLIAKLLRPTSGRILIQNTNHELQDLHQNSRNLIKLGFLIDIPAFYDMTAYQLLKYYALLQDYPQDEINKRIDDLLKLFKLYDWKHKNVKKFSKGMAQKLGIIQAIIHEPEIVILDEPQTGLDPKARIDIRSFIKELQDQGKTIFVASHMLYEISEVCDKIALLSHGGIIGFDTIDNLEKSLKTKSLKCQIIDEINQEDVDLLIRKITDKLHPFLDPDLDPQISENQIVYNNINKTFKIFYDGKVQSRVAILKSLIKDFDLNITAFTLPKASKLESIYSEMISDEEVDQRKKKKKWWRRQ